jgi:hypothetical protein
VAGASVRDIEVIDCELRLLAAFRQNFRDGKCRAPSIARIDELLDERWEFQVAEFRMSFSQSVMVTTAIQPWSPAKTHPSDHPKRHPRQNPV